MTNLRKRPDTATTEPDQLQHARLPDRPRSHHGNSAAEIEIFDACERLLSNVPLSDVSVASIIAEAGVSRGTFYFYFSSKFAVLNGLLARIMDQISEVMQSFMHREASETPEQALRRSLEMASNLWHSHRSVLRATHENWHAVPELRQRWLLFVESFTTTVAEHIDSERSKGVAPAGVDSRLLASTLLWGMEGALYVAGLGIDPELQSEKDVVDASIPIWISSIYGKPVPPPI